MARLGLVYEFLQAPLMDELFNSIVHDKTGISLVIRTIVIVTKLIKVLASISHRWWRRNLVLIIHIENIFLIVDQNRIFIVFGI